MPHSRSAVFMFLSNNFQEMPAEKPQQEAAWGGPLASPHSSKAQLSRTVHDLGWGWGDALV